MIFRIKKAPRENGAFLLRKFPSGLCHGLETLHADLDPLACASCPDFYGAKVGVEYPLVDIVCV